MKMEKVDLKELQNLFGENYTINLDGREIEVEPLTVKQMAKVSMMQEKGDMVGAITLAVSETLKSGIEGITDDQINKIKPKVLGEVIPQILKGNGLEGDAKKKLDES